MRSLRYLFIFFLLFLFLGTTFALFSAEDFIAQFQIQEAPLSSSEKKIYYTKVIDNLNFLALKNRLDEQQYQLYMSLRSYVQAQMETLEISPSTTVSFTLTSSGMTIPNVDLARVRDIRLSLHNTERQTQSLTPFTYNLALEGTASTWAQHLATLRTTTHKRKTTDGYYSYESIKSWFINQGIIFSNPDDQNGNLFTENIGWNLYLCKKSDCTDDFIKAIKKSRMFFMSEKGKKYSPHYNAIVGNYSDIGVGVALVGNKYYLVAHYTQALK